MAFCNKIGNLLRQSASQTRQSPSSMLNYLRHMLSSKLFIGENQDTKIPHQNNGVIDEDKVKKWSRYHRGVRIPLLKARKDCLRHTNEANEASKGCCIKNGKFPHSSFSQGHHLNDK